ncbi:hypothetical protein PTTG_31046, partial [Puccinia triticina 1-1 BBBD Race 1]
MARPSSIRLALGDGSAMPLTIRHFVVATLRVTRPTLIFEDTSLRVGPVLGDFDLILGTPFLHRHGLSVSVEQQAMECSRLNVLIPDYRVDPGQFQSIAAVNAPSEANQYPCAESERLILKEFADLFPEDIPAVDEDVDDSDQSKGSSFPNKLQDAASRTRHKIVLTDPNA